MRIQNFFPLGVLLAAATIAGCSADNTASTLGNGGSVSSSNTGGKANGGAATGAGGGSAVGGTSGAVGGTTSSNHTGGATSNGATGGTPTNPTGGNGNAPTGGAAANPTGGNGNTPTGGKAAAGGSGNTPTGGTPANPTGGAGNNTSTGGQAPATGGTATATGGSSSASVTPVTPSCPTGNNSEGVPNAANPAAADVISDFNTSGDSTNYPCITDPNHQANPCSDPHLIVYKTGTRGGTLWYGYTDYDTDPDSATTTSRSLPTLSWDGTQGACTANGAMHIKGVGNTGWGSGIGVDLMPRNSSNQKQAYNASSYTGVGFNMKCAADVGYVYFKLIDAVNDGDCATSSCGISSVCVYSGSGTICNQWGYKNAWVTKNWANYELYFADALQDPNAALGTATGPDKSKVTALQMQFNTGYDTSGGNKVATSFECWVDDVHFLTGSPPTPKTTCSSGAYTTSGNKIMCGSTQKIFRGVARPSMEWDTSGWNVMPWDMARIKNGWKANLVRIGMNQDYYMGTSTASTAQIYPKYVARAARWAEANGMDVILDLHWVDSNHPSSTQNYMASASTGSTTFWTKCAGDFKSDNHVMFELYNEPTITSWTDWHNNYTALYSAVRGASANQITIIGGLDWAYDLSGVSANAISGTNIVYNTHPYGNKAPSSDWPAKFGNLAATQPVMATEFGDNGNNGGTCAGAWTQSLITYMEGLGMSWTAWGWYAGGGCAFPSLISSYDGTVLNGAGSNADASKQGMAKNP